MESKKSLDEEIALLEKQVKDLEEKVREREASLPAHSVRVNQIMELEALEEERDAARERLRELVRQKGDS